MHDRARLTLAILIFLTMFNAAYTQQKSPWWTLAEDILKCIPDTEAVLIIQYPMVHYAVKRVHELSGTHPNLKIYYGKKSIVDELPKIKGKIPIYTFGVCSIDPYIEPESLSFYGLVDVYNPSGRNTIDTSYQLLMNSDLSFLEDPLYYDDTFYCNVRYSYSALLGNIFVNVYNYMRGKSPAKADSLVNKLKPYLENMPWFVEFLLRVAIDEDSTKIHGMSVDTLLDILGDWCDRNPNTFMIKRMRRSVEYYKVKLKKEPNP